MKCVGRLMVGLCAVVVACVVVSQLSACNTVKGVGRDIEAMGQGGQDMIDGKK